MGVWSIILQPPVHMNTHPSTTPQCLRRVPIWDPLSIRGCMTSMAMWSGFHGRNHQCGGISGKRQCFCVEGVIRQGSIQPCFQRQTRFIEPSRNLDIPWWAGLPGLLHPHGPSQTKVFCCFKDHSLHHCNSTRSPQPRKREAEILGEALFGSLLKTRVDTGPYLAWRTGVDQRTFQQHVPTKEGREEVLRGLKQ